MPQIAVLDLHDPAPVRRDDRGAFIVVCGRAPSFPGKTLRAIAVGVNPVDRPCPLSIRPPASASRIGGIVADQTWAVRAYGASAEATPPYPRNRITVWCEWTDGSVSHSTANVGGMLVNSEFSDPLLDQTDTFPPAASSIAEPIDADFTTAADDETGDITPRTPVGALLEVLRQPIQSRPDDWHYWPNVQSAHLRLFADYILDIQEPPNFPIDRGIVVIGGGRYLPSAYVTIRVLRHVGCKLPIQLWHLADEVDEPMVRLLAGYDVTCVDADAHDREQPCPFRFMHGHWSKGWQLKPYALVHSSFREVLLLDADSYPVRDPTFLFQWRPYRERGAIIFPDVEIWRGTLTDNLRLFGVEHCDDLPAESGQLLVDKQLCWREVNLALKFNEHADYVYRILHGDKDTFPIAWWRLGRQYARMWPSCDVNEQSILQYDDEGQVLFQHRVMDKFVLAPTAFDSTPQADVANRYNPELAHEDFCFAALRELASVWRPPG